MPNANVPVVKKPALIEPGLITGFLSARSGMAIPKGEAGLLCDIRLDDGTVRLRWGAAWINTAINTTQTYRGSFECSFSGTPSLFVATSDGTHVSVLRSIDAGVTWTNITPSSGSYGDTRLTDTNLPVYFELVNQFSQDYLIVQNGTDAPRFWDGTIMGIVPALDSSIYGLSETVDLGGGSKFVSATSIVAINSVRFNGEIRSVGSGNYLYLNCNTQTDTSPIDYVTVNGLGDGFTIATIPTAGITPQILLFLDAGNLPTKSTTTGSSTETTGNTITDERWRSMLIEGSDGTGGTPTWYTIYDPATTPLIAVPVENTTFYLAAFPVTTANAGKQVVNLRFSFPEKYGETSDPQIYLKLYTFQNSGTQPGGTSYGASFGKPGTTLAADGPTRSAGRIVTADKVTPYSYGGTPLPISGAIYYDYRVRITSPTPGVQVPTYIYRNDVGSSGYYYLASFLGTGVYNDTGTTDVDFTRELLDGNALGIPKGTGMATINGRLFVCSGNRLYYSESDRPFIFSLNVRFDDSNQVIAESAGSFSRAGEVFQSVVPIGGFQVGTQTGQPISGAVSIYALTDRSLGAMSGYDALSLNKFRPIGPGTRAPLSVSLTTGGFYYLDAQRQVRIVRDGQTQVLSKYRVDDQLRPIPTSTLPWASGTCIDERYYLAYSSGGANDTIIVYNESLGWESVDRPRAMPSGLLPYYDASVSRTRLFVFSDVGLFEHSEYGQNNDLDQTGVSGLVVLSEIQLGQKTSKFGTATFITDPDPSGTLTLTVVSTTGDRAPSVPYPGVSMAARSSSDTRIGVRTEINVGGDSLSIQPRIVMLAAGGRRLYRMDLELNEGSDSIQP